jgi:hypothetical protein
MRSRSDGVLRGRAGRWSSVLTIFLSGTLGCGPTAAVRKRATFYMKLIILPRQAQDKHWKSTQKGRNRVLAEVPLGLMSWGSNPYPYAPDGSPAAVRGSGRGGGDLESGLDNSVLGGAFRFNETGREVQDGYDAGYTGLYLMDCLAQARTRHKRHHSATSLSLVLSHFRWMSTANLPRRSHTDRNHVETLNRD